MNLNWLMVTIGIKSPNTSKNIHQAYFIAGLLGTFSRILAAETSETIKTNSGHAIVILPALYMNETFLRLIEKNDTNPNLCRANI